MIGLFFNKQTLEELVQKVNFYHTDRLEMQLIRYNLLCIVHLRAVLMNWNLTKHTEILFNLQPCVWNSEGQMEDYLEEGRDSFEKGRDSFEISNKYYVNLYCPCIITKDKFD
jgi:hypothetical protein